MRFFKTFAIVLCTIVLCSCSLGGFSKKQTIIASGNLVSKNIELASFDRVSCSIPVDIVYNGGEQKITALLSDNIVNLVNFTVKNGELFIECKDYNLRNTKNDVITISLPEIHKYTVNGSSDFKSMFGLQSSDLAVKINGSGDFEVKNCKVENFGITVNGSGDIDLENVNCGEIVIRVNGSGDVEVNGECKYIDVTINGSGDIDLRGLDADEVNTKINGAGKLIGGKKR